MDAGAGAYRVFSSGRIRAGCSERLWEDGLGSSSLALSGLGRPLGLCIFSSGRYSRPRRQRLYPGHWPNVPSSPATFIFHLITGLIYPVFGSWAWGGLFNGGGWLESLGFIDFAGSTVVHSVGGWAALAGALVVGPRVGKYDKDGKPNHASRDIASRWRRWAFSFCGLAGLVSMQDRQLPVPQISR